MFLCCAVLMEMVYKSQASLPTSMAFTPRFYREDCSCTLANKISAVNSEIFSSDGDSGPWRSLLWRNPSYLRGRFSYAAQHLAQNLTSSILHHRNL